MEYRITKDSGVEWDETLATKPFAWGVSENQLQRAQKVAVGDVLLHYIDRAHAWAGYSTVSGVLKKNDRDSHEDWLAALPYVIPIECGVLLNEGQAERTVSVDGLCGKHYHRCATFNRVHSTEAERIIDAIKSASTEQLKASAAFHNRWRIGAENYYKGIVKGLAGGKCWLCRHDAASWASQANIALSAEELDSIRESFLDAAHIVADCKDGPMTPDNLRSLCTNCHRVVDRLPIDRRKQILNKKQAT